jgi:hypothetical protein
MRLPPQTAIVNRHAGALLREFSDDAGTYAASAANYQRSLASQTG